MHVLLSEGAGTYAVAKEREVTSLEEGQDVNASFTVRSDVAKDTMSDKMSDKFGVADGVEDGVDDSGITKTSVGSPLLPLPATSTTCTKFSR